MVPSKTLCNFSTLACQLEMKVKPFTKTRVLPIREMEAKMDSVSDWFDRAWLSSISGVVMKIPVIILVFMPLVQGARQTVTECVADATGKNDSTQAFTSCLATTPAGDVYVPA